MSLELHQPQVSDLQARMNYAEALAVSDLLPKQYQRRPANVLLAIELGQALGIPTIQAINGIHVVEGKPTASADLIASLVRRAGHKLRVTETETKDGPAVTASLIRADDPEFVFTCTWDMGKARAAGLAGKGVWKQYPGQMLRSRAITEVARQGASDALYGVIYTAEELGAETPLAGPQAAAQAPPTRLPAEPAGQPDAAPEAMTVEQSRRLAELMKAESMGKDEMLTFARDMTGRADIASAKDLSHDEAALVIAGLESTVGQVDADTGEVHIVDGAETVDAELVTEES